VLLIGMAKTL